MTKYEYFAINHFLSSYPENSTYDEIIQELKGICPLEEYEDFSNHSLGLMINDLKKELEKNFLPK